MLQVEHLSVSFVTRLGINRAVDDISFTVQPGQITAIIGESGSGKSVACYSLLGLIPQPPGRIDGGRALFQGQDLLQLTTAELRKIRGRDIAMVFQDPMTCLNPYMTVGAQLMEPLRLSQEGVADARAPTGTGTAGRSGHTRARRHHRQLPAPVLRRHAPARNDRHGADQRTATVDRRRTHHRAGRHHSGANPGTAGFNTKEARYRHRIYQSRPRRRGGHRRPDCGDAGRPRSSRLAIATAFSATPATPTRENCCRPFPRAANRKNCPHRHRWSRCGICAPGFTRAQGQ